MTWRTFKIWLLLCFIHVAIVFILPLIRENWIIGIGVIYLTILALGKIGLSGVLHLTEGWGLPSPTVMGWSVGIFIWMLLYWLLSMAIARILTSRTKDKVV